MVLTLSSLKNSSRKYKRCKLLGRGTGSKHGKTSCRGQKGMGARSGYQVRAGCEGGGVPLHKRMPKRGFSNAKFACKFDVINLGQIDLLYKDKEVVSVDSLREKGFIKGKSNGLKVLSHGKLTKKVKFQEVLFSKRAKELLNI